MSNHRKNSQSKRYNSFSSPDESVETRARESSRKLRAKVTSLDSISCKRNKSCSSLVLRFARTSRLGRALCAFPLALCAGFLFLPDRARLVASLGKILLVLNNKKKVHMIHFINKTAASWHFFKKNLNCSPLYLGGTRKKIRYFGGDPGKKMEIFTHPPPLINNERSLMAA